jgi:hypothetical protein
LTTALGLSLGIVASTACTRPPEPPSCRPSTCEELGLVCGSAEAGCGQTLECGECAAGQLCSAGVCKCAPISCTTLGVQCGPISDGCGGAVDCGTCPADHVCGADGRCVCTPRTCAALGLQCGIASDGCGAQLNCGVCSDQSVCSASGSCVAMEGQCIGHRWCVERVSPGPTALLAQTPACGHVVAGTGGFAARRLAGRWVDIGGGLPAGTPGADFVNGLGGTSDSDIWAVRGADVIHYDGSSWTRVFAPTFPNGYAPLSGVGASAPNDVWVVSNGGRLFHFDGQQWTNADVGPPLYGLGEVWAGADGVAWSGARDGKLVRLSDGGYQIVVLPGGGTTTELWGANPTDVWAAAPEGVIHHFDGQTWKQQTLPLTASWRGIGGSGKDDVWFPGTGARTLRWNGSRFQSIERTDGGAVQVDAGFQGTVAVLARRPDDVALFGDSVSLEWNGWTIVPFDSGRFGPYASWVSPSGRLYGAFYNRVSVWQPPGWEILNTKIGEDFAGLTPSHCHGVTRTGDFGSVFPNPAYSRPAGDAGFRAIWTESGERGYAVGDQGLVVRIDNFSGPATAIEPLGDAGAPLPTLTGVCGLGGRYAWAVGTGGRLFERDGFWREVKNSPTTADLLSAWGSSDGGGWAVGSGATVLRRSVGGWSLRNVPATQTLRSVHGLADDDVWAVGEFGTVLHFDGASWNRVELGTTAVNLTSVLAVHPWEVYAGADNGLLFRYRPLRTLP